MLSRLPTALSLSLLSLLTTSAATTPPSHSTQQEPPCDPTQHTHTHTIHAWPLSAASPSPLATIRYLHCPNSPPSLFHLDSFTPPSQSALSQTDLVRIGGFIPNAPTDTEEHWDGSVTSTETFAGAKLTLTVWADGAGADGIWRSSIAWRQAESAGKEARKSRRAEGVEDVKLVVRVPEVGPKPFLNKPVVLDETGKVKTADKDERTFLQKYWWMIAIFLVMQVITAGGGGKE